MFQSFLPSVLVYNVTAYPRCHILYHSLSGLEPSNPNFEVAAPLPGELVTGQRNGQGILVVRPPQPEVAYCGVLQAMIPVFCALTHFADRIPVFGGGATVAHY